MWFRRAYTNLHFLGSKNLSLKAGWAAGAWFVPIVNLIWPYKIMREIWFETQSMFRGNDEIFTIKKIAIVRWWWGLNLIGLVHLTLKLFRVIDVKNGSKEIIMSGDIISFVMNTIECLLLISIIKQISVWDEEMNLRFQNQQALSYGTQFNS